MGSIKTFYNGVVMVMDLLFVILLLIVAMIDLKTMKIPNYFVLAILILGIIETMMNPSVSLLSRGLGACIVSIPLGLVNLVIPGSFGGGDVKLMSACGIFLGWKLCLLSFVLAILSGGIYGIYLLIGKKAQRKDRFAFAPFLSMGMIVALFWGVDLVTWYLQIWGIR